MDSGLDLDSQEMDRLMDDLGEWDAEPPKKKKERKVEFSKKDDIFDDTAIGIGKSESPPRPRSEEIVNKSEPSQAEDRSKVRKSLMSNLFDDEPKEKPVHLATRKASASKSLFDDVNDPLDEHPPSKTKGDTSYFDTILGKKPQQKTFQSESVLDYKNPISTGQKIPSANTTPKRRPGSSRRSAVFEIDDSDILKTNRKVENLDSKPPEDDWLKEPPKSTETVAESSGWLQQATNPPKSASEMTGNVNAANKANWMTNLIGSKSAAPHHATGTTENSANLIKAGQVEGYLNANVSEMTNLVGKLEAEFQIKMAEYQKQQQINLLKCFESLHTSEGAMEMHENLKKYQVRKILQYN